MVDRFELKCQVVAEGAIETQVRITIRTKKINQGAKDRKKGGLSTALFLWKSFGRFPNPQVDLVVTESKVLQAGFRLKARGHGADE